MQKQDVALAGRVRWLRQGKGLVSRLTGSRVVDARARLLRRRGSTILEVEALDGSKRAVVCVDAGCAIDVTPRDGPRGAFSVGPWGEAGVVLVAPHRGAWLLALGARLLAGRAGLGGSGTWRHACLRGSPHSRALCDDAAGSNDVHARDARGRAPLHVAAARASVAPWLARGAAVGLVDGTGATALHVACAAARPDCVGALVAAGAPTSKRDCRGAAPAHALVLAAARADAADAGAAAAALGPDALAARDGRGFTAAHALAFGRRPAALAAFLGAGADANARLLARPPPHTRAARGGLGRGATPLHCCFAAPENPDDVAAAAEALVRGGAAPAARDAAGAYAPELAFARASAPEPCPPALVAAVVAVCAAADARDAPDAVALRAACAACAAAVGATPGADASWGGLALALEKGAPARPSAILSLLPAAWTRAAAPAPSPRRPRTAEGLGGLGKAAAERGERLSRLAAKAGELDDAAADFERACARLNRRNNGWW